MFLKKKFKQKAFRTIENSIDYAFYKSKGLMKTSFKYQYIGLCDKGNEVYITARKIPPTIMGTELTTGTFEIHFDPKKKIINEIYLVV